MGSCCLLQEIFLTWGLNPSLLYFRWILYRLSYQENPRILKWVAYSFSRGSSLPRDPTLVSCIAGRSFTVWGSREVLLVQCPLDYRKPFWVNWVCLGRCGIFYCSSCSCFLFLGHSGKRGPHPPSCTRGRRSACRPLGLCWFLCRTVGFSWPLGFQCWELQRWNWHHLGFLGAMLSLTAEVCGHCPRAGPRGLPPVCSIFKFYFILSDS